MEKSKRGANKNYDKATEDRQIELAETAFKLLPGVLASGHTPFTKAPAAAFFVAEQFLKELLERDLDIQDVKLTLE